MRDGAVASAMSDDTVPQRGDRPPPARTPDGEPTVPDPAGAEIRSGTCALHPNRQGSEGN